MTAKSIHLILGFSPGSTSDQIARLIAPALGERLGATVEIELQPGSNGAKAARAVADAAPDGNTLFMATLGTHALAPHLNRSLSYDPRRDFAAVSLISKSPLVLGCSQSARASDIAGLIALARERPGALTYGTSAIGGAPHLAAELFQAMAGIKMRHVRYDETERLYRDLETGRVTMSFNNIMSMLPRCRRGPLRALGVSSAARSAVAPELPAIAEALPGYEVTNWLGIVAPKATPRPLVEKLSEAVAAVVRSDAVATAFQSGGVEPCGSTPAEFEQFMAAEIDRWGPIVAAFRDTNA